MNWMDTFIDRTLEKVPEGRCRRRMERELRDHLETQCRALTEAGRTEDEAQAETLRVMGEPEKLKLEYEAAWRRTPLPQTWRQVSSITVGCVITGVLNLVISLLMFWMQIRMEDQFLPGSLYDIQNLLFFLLMLFLVPYSVTGLYLHFRVGRERHPIRVVTAGLLAAWLGERVFPLVICAADGRLSLGPELFEHLSDYTIFPICSPAYMAASFAGCLLLGQFFGRFLEREEEAAA